MKELKVLLIGLVVTAAMAWPLGAEVQGALLPNVNGGSFSSGAAVNDGGVAVGLGNDGVGVVGVRWNLNADPLEAVVLNPLPGNAYSAAYGINAAGVVVGESGEVIGEGAEAVADGTIVAVYWEGENAVVLPAPEGNVGTYAAYSINSVNLIVGESAVGVEGNTVAVLWDGASAAAQVTVLHQEGWEYSSAYYIHDDGIIVGEAKPAGQTSQGVIWTPIGGNDYTVTLLPPAEGDVFSVAYGIGVPLGEATPPSHVVGETVGVDGTVRGIVWTLSMDGATINDTQVLAENTSAQDVNDFNVIVGYTGAGTGNDRAASWNMANLGVARNIGPADSFSQAYAVNNANEVVGLQDGQAMLVSATVTLARANIGVFRNGQWYLDGNGNGVWEVGTDVRHFFGIAGDFAVVGDWNGDGRKQIGVFRNGDWYLDTNGNGIWEAGIDTRYRFGIAGDVPVVGDWSGDGLTQIGVFRNGDWYLDTDGNGAWNVATDTRYRFGIAGDAPVVGDWSGDGLTQIGVFRNGDWYLDSNGNGIWEAGTDTRYRFGIAGDAPVVGDWSGDGLTRIGVFRNGDWYLDSDGNGVWNVGTDTRYRFGIAGDRPVSGAW